MRVFQASIEQMLWPEKRKHDRLLGDTDAGDPIYDIDRTTERSYISHAGGLCAGSRCVRCRPR